MCHSIQVGSISAYGLMMWGMCDCPFGPPKPMWAQSGLTRWPPDGPCSWYVGGPHMDYWWGPCGPKHKTHQLQPTCFPSETHQVPTQAISSHLNPTYQVPTKSLPSSNLKPTRFPPKAYLLIIRNPPGSHLKPTCFPAYLLPTRFPPKPHQVTGETTQPSASSM